MINFSSNPEPQVVEGNDPNSRSCSYQTLLVSGSSLFVELTTVQGLMRIKKRLDRIGFFYIGISKTRSLNARINNPHADSPDVNSSTEHP
ncbi:unnamed protein product [Brassica oleracea var. botrytis]